MSEWLGKPRLIEEDIEEYQPSMKKYFPWLVKYFVDDQKFKVMASLSHETFDSFKKAVTKEYGKFTSKEINGALEQAIKNWIDLKTKGLK
jgi:hypothetical protein